MNPTVPTAAVSRRGFLGHATGGLPAARKVGHPGRYQRVCPVG